MIKILDDAFDFTYTEDVWNFVSKSLYQLGWLDSNAIEHAAKPCLHSSFTHEDVVNLGILEKIKETEIAELVNFDNFEKCIINLTVAGQTHVEHSHVNSDVVLYYCNPVWRREWGGETMFYDAKNKDIYKSIEYKPNRLAFFNGEHPHSIRAPSFDATMFRFTVTLFFNKN